MEKTTKALRIELEDQKNKFFKLSKEFGIFMYETKDKVCRMKDDFDREMSQIKQEFRNSISIEKKRTDRVVMVLLNNLPQENLNKPIRFSGTDCCGKYRRFGDDYYHDGKTLRDFLNLVIDP